jgi:signal transduction histidine kinase
VLANLELLQASLQAPEHGEEEEMIESALRSSKRMSRLVSDLLLLARADSGRVSERTPCDLAEVVKGAIGEIEPVADGHSLTLTGAAPVKLTGNADELHRMVLNLLENAIHHTPRGTSVDVSLAQGAGKVTLEVSDNGPGIPPDLSEQVFDRFVRAAGPADTAGSGGTGLGLSIVRAVAEGHGGRVWVTPSKHGGAAFHVELSADHPAGVEPKPADEVIKTRLGAL